MGIDANMVRLMSEAGISGRGASFGYPHYIRREGGSQSKERSEKIFENLGVEFPTVFDVGPLPGYEIQILDLNYPIPDALLGRYDYIINPGTYEFVFNIGQAVANGYNMTKPGGLAFHHGALARPKFGYWNMSRKSWHEFCELNGSLLHFEDYGWTYYAVMRRGPRGVRWPQENNVR